MLRAAVATLLLPATLMATSAGGRGPSSGGPTVIVQPGGDVANGYSSAPQDADFFRREVMIPMRDGVRLFTVLLVPKGAADAPIVMNRTPYDASSRATRTQGGVMADAVPREDDAFARAGYIRVWQDIRGKYKSEGDYVVTRPMIGPLNPTNVDHSTDAWDTIAWLTDRKNLPEGNGRVGMIGSSYEGTTAAMALIHPHPALKVAAPESPLIDGWLGDDWFHHGAFRLRMADYIAEQTGAREKAKAPARGGYDDYENFLAGSAGAWGTARGYDQLPFWRRLVEHPAYDAVWQGLALDKLLAANPSDVPTLWVQPLWDQEDSYGAIHAFETLRAAGRAGNNHLVLGPWFHSQVNRSDQGRGIGPLKWNGNTTDYYWRQIVLPFFDEYLRDGPSANLPAAIAYNTGVDRWERYDHWPLAGDKGSGAPTPLTPMYLSNAGGLTFAAVARGQDSYVSDPAKPVPYLPRPINFDDGRWPTWLVSDQRSVDGRPDVLTYRTKVLDQPVRIAGAPIADLYARITGADVDFVVKVIDVYPSENGYDPAMGGYQLPISLEIFRGRYRDSFELPTPVPSGKVQHYRFRLPTVNHVFKPGHRIMVQIQSSLFPLYDRNPQTWVSNIFLATPSDYRAQTVTLERGGAQASSVLLPVVRVAE